MEQAERNGRAGKAAPCCAPFVHTRAAHALLFNAKADGTFAGVSPEHVPVREVTFAVTPASKRSRGRSLAPRA